MSHLKSYTRIVVTEDGGPMFEDAAIEPTEQQAAARVPPMFVGALSPAAAVVLLRSAEFDSQPHPASREQWVLMLRGAIERQVSDPARRRFEPGRPRVRQRHRRTRSRHVRPPRPALRGVVSRPKALSRR
jgi:hypothetical protein